MAWESTGSNRANLLSFQSAVDSMVSNENLLVIACAVTISGATLTYIYGGPGGSVAFKVGIAALGVTGTAATAAYNIHVAVGNADYYYGQIVNG